MTSGVIAGVVLDTTSFATLTMIPGALHHFNFTTPSTAIGGKWVEIDVEARDQYDRVATGYTGTPALESTDPLATVVVAGSDTVITSIAVDDFVAGLTTLNVTFNTYGYQTLNLTDGIESMSDPIQITSEFAATVSPLFVKTGSYWFEVSVENNASSLALNIATITYPTVAGWTINNIEAASGWLLTDANEYTATGGFELNIGESALFRFNMTTTASGDFTVKVKNVIGEDYYPMHTISIEVDGTPPGITVVRPTEAEQTDGYSVGVGNKIWINATVTDLYSYTPVMYINATGFDYTITLIAGSDYDWNVYFYNVSNIPEGPLAFYINATDGAGNVGTTKTDPIVVEIDNTAPEITIQVYDAAGTTELPLVDGMYYMGADITSINFNYTGLDIAFDTDVDYTYVYVNTTMILQGGTVQGQNETLQTLSVSSVNYLVINVTLTDTASPNNHTTTLLQTVIRDLVGPHAIGYTDYETISGGLIVRGLYANDTVGVYDYIFSMNGTNEANITQEDLSSQEWTETVGFNGIVVLNLAQYAGDLVNITVIGRDYGENEGVEAIVYEGIVPEGLWVPVSLYTGWNLVSLPLIPDSSESADILSLILDQGASGVVVSYGYDHVGDTWITNPTEMTDGNGYWLYMLANDVMIVEGIETLPAPSSPQTYEYTEGWVLAGYKQLGEHNITDYCDSFETSSYFTTVYVWDAVGPGWATVSEAQTLSPGQGFWLFLYSDQSLIAPLEE